MSDGLNRNILLYILIRVSTFAEFTHEFKSVNFFLFPGPISAYKFDALHVNKRYYLRYRPSACVEIMISLCGSFSPRPFDLECTQCVNIRSDVVYARATHFGSSTHLP